MPIGEPFVQLIAVDSTNNYAMAQVQAHLAGHGAAWFANTQNQGKGQRGKAWLSQPGQNIILSLAIKPQPLKINEQFLLSAAVALGCHSFFSAHTQDETKIKWPNDIYWKDRKAGGILIENVLHGNDWRFAIVGIGLNINQTAFPPNLHNPVSLRQVTGKTYNASTLAKELCGCIENRWQQVLTGQNSALLDDYNTNLYKLNEVITLKANNAIFSALLKGVNEKGELLINTSHETTIPIGQVQWVLPK